MFDWIQTAAAQLAQSDLGPAPPPLWHIVVTGQTAHTLIGTCLALFRAPALLVIADSMADLCFGALGYIIAKYQMEKYRHDQS